MSISRPPAAAGAPRHAAGEVVLARYPDVARLQESVAAFRSQPDTPVQGNEITSVSSGRYPVDALRRWYPTNPQSLYRAMVVDEPQRVTLVLEVNSLSREDFDAMSAPKVADALADFLERSHSAAPAAPPSVPDWAGSVWEDARNTFHIAIATGWTQDPAAGAMASLTAYPHFVDAERPASMVVTATRPDHPLPLPGLMEQARAGAGRQGCTIESEEPMTRDDGEPAQRLELTHGGRRFMTVLVVTDTDAFVITGGAPPDRWAAKQDDMLRMARSFGAEP